MREGTQAGCKTDSLSQGREGTRPAQLYNVGGWKDLLMQHILDCNVCFVFVNITCTGDQIQQDADGRWFCEWILAFIQVKQTRARAAVPAATLVPFLFVRMTYSTRCTCLLSHHCTACIRLLARHLTVILEHHRLKLCLVCVHCTGVNNMAQATFHVVKASPHSEHWTP